VRRAAVMLVAAALCACGPKGAKTNTGGDDAGPMDLGDGGAFCLPACTAAQTCLQGVCCDNPCGLLCCVAGQKCLKDPEGFGICGNTCKSSSECPKADPCCALQPDGTGACALDDSNMVACLCNTGADCTPFNQFLSACAPLVIDAGPLGPAQAGPYVCRPNNGSGGGGCNGGVSCEFGQCWEDAKGNDICTTSCNASFPCGGGCCDMGTCANDGGDCGDLGDGGLGYCGPC